MGKDAKKTAHCTMNVQRVAYLCMYKTKCKGSVLFTPPLLTCVNILLSSIVCAWY